MDFVTVSTGLILPYWMGLPIRYIHDLDLDEDRILYAFEKAKQEKTYDHTEVWKMLGV